MNILTQVKENELENLIESNIESHKLVIVDFTAKWCGPCTQINPSIEKLAKEYEGRAEVVTVDIDTDKPAAKKYGIRNIPSVLFFQEGHRVDTIVGVVPYKKFTETTKKHLETSQS
ncbi:MAG: thioredoxin domain-containing protein [Cyanobacteria bacterium P01_A01_bin.45]